MGDCFQTHKTQAQPRMTGDQSTPTQTRPLNVRALDGSWMARRKQKEKTKEKRKTQRETGRVSSVDAFSAHDIISEAHGAHAFLNRLPMNTYRIQRRTRIQSKTVQTEQTSCMMDTHANAHLHTVGRMSRNGKFLSLPSPLSTH